MKLRLVAVAIAVSLVGKAHAGAQEDGEAYLTWSQATAESVGRSARASGRVGGFFDLRVKSTNKAYNYRLRATWLTPEAIRAAARLEQLRNRLSDGETRRLVAEAEAEADTVVLVEIDPREGSGVIPLDWTCFLQAKRAAVAAPTVRGTQRPGLRNQVVLRGVEKRDYAFDQFWVVFPLRTPDGAPLFSSDDQEAELVVRIHEKEGRTSWPITQSIRERLAQLSR